MIAAVVGPVDVGAVGGDACGRVLPGGEQGGLLAAPAGGARADLIAVVVRPVDAGLAERDALAAEQRAGERRQRPGAAGEGACEDTAPLLVTVYSEEHGRRGHDDGERIVERGPEHGGSTGAPRERTAQ